MAFMALLPSIFCLANKTRQKRVMTMPIILDADAFLDGGNTQSLDLTRST